MRFLKNIGATIAFTLVFILPTEGLAQNIVRLQCAAGIERIGDTLIFSSQIMANLSVTVDYDMEISYLSAGNLGATSQGGTLALTANSAMRTAAAQVRLNGPGYYEVELTVQDRMTGETCVDKKTIFL